MLVLSRKLGERIIIEPGIEIAVVDVRGGRVRLGIEAPAEVAVRRVELVPFDLQPVSIESPCADA